jgi:hypothetical protein
MSQNMRIFFTAIAALGCLGTQAAAHVTSNSKTQETKKSGPAACAIAELVNGPAKKGHHKESAMSRCLAFMLFIAIAVWSELPAQIQDENSFYSKPIARLAQCEFVSQLDHCDHPGTKTLGVVSGTWVASSGTFNSTSTSTAIATIDEYIRPSENSAPVFEIGSRKVWYRARMLNQRNGSSTRVGIVYHYQDADNFYEVSFSPTGSVFVRDTSNGVSTTVATGTYTGGGQNKWFDVEIHWTEAETIIRANGLVVVGGIRQDARTQGLAGLITRQTTAKFDRLLVMREYGDPEFRETFSGGAPSWDVIKGNWNVVNGVYQNSAVQYGSIVELPIFLGMDSNRQTQWFDIRARMLNPYGASGNRMGFVYRKDGDNGFNDYEEIVFGADGIARINRVSTSVGPDGTTNVTVIPLERAPYPFTRNQWFDVRFTGDSSLDNPFDHVFDVSVNGTPVFTGFEALDVRGLGLITNFTPGRFDDVWFCHDTCRGGVSTETFEDNVNPFLRGWSPLRGTWDTEGNVLNNRTVGAKDIVTMKEQPGSTNYKLSARMLNPYGASGNRVGFIFNFESIVAVRDGGEPIAEEYYEVVFATTGQAYINKFIQGQLTQVATAAHSAGRNVWFNVEFTRQGPNATVKVNNQIVFENVQVAQLDHSFDSGFEPHIGVISHWAPGRFDDLRLEIPLGR